MVIFPEIYNGYFMTLSIIAGKYRGKKLNPCPRDSGVRPTSNLLRGAIFDITRSQLQGASFLDLYAGSGAVGFEALSQGVKKTVLVENNFKLFKVLEKNSSFFVSENLQLHRGRSLNFCKKCLGEKNTFDLIFADPPFYLDFSLLFAKMRQILAKRGTLMIQFPTRNRPIWTNEFQLVKKYGESSLAIFYN